MNAEQLEQYKIEMWREMYMLCIRHYDERFDAKIEADKMVDAFNEKFDLK